MFEGLIDAIEEAILLPAAAIAAKDELTALNRCEDILPSCCSSVRRALVLRVFLRGCSGR